jgi:hypothetical protein
LVILNPVGQGNQIYKNHGPDMNAIPTDLESPNGGDAMRRGRTDRSDFKRNLCIGLLAESYARNKQKKRGIP